jgi:uncharacterized protein YukE
VVIEIDTENVLSDITNIKKLYSDISGIMVNLNSNDNWLKNAWTGKASDAYFVAKSDFTTKMNNWITNSGKGFDTVNKLVAEYETIDKKWSKEFDF